MHLLSLIQINRPKFGAFIVVHNLNLKGLADAEIALPDDWWGKPVSSGW